MDIDTADIEAVTVSDILELATWNRQRSSDELQRFIRSHAAHLPEDTELA